MKRTKELAMLLALAASVYGADLSTGSVAAVSGHTVGSSVNLNTQGAQISGVQFDLLYDTTSLTISIAAGSAATV